MREESIMVDTEKRIERRRSIVEKISAYLRTYHVSVAFPDELPESDLDSIEELDEALGTAL